MKKLLMVSAVLAAMASTSYANEDLLKLDPKFYAGASAGRSSVDTGISTGTASLDEDDVAYKVYGGVQLNKILGLEAHFADLGEATLSGNNGNTFTSKGTTYTFNQSAKISIGAKSFGLGATAGYKFGPFRPFAKLGFHRWDLDANLNSGTSSASTSDTGFDAFFGLGAEVTVYEGLNIRAEAERYQVEDYDVDVLSLGIVYRF